MLFFTLLPDEIRKYWCFLICPLPEFTPRPALLDLTAADILSLIPETYASLLRHSAIKRVKLAGLMRNIRHLISQDRLTDDTHPPAGNLYDKSL